MHATMEMNLENIILSERSQTKSYIIDYIYIKYLEQVKSLATEDRIVVVRGYRKENGVWLTENSFL
jgi:hypothetical protein